MPCTSACHAHQYVIACTSACHASHITMPCQSHQHASHISMYLEVFHPEPNSFGQYPIFKCLGANSGIHFASNGAAPAIVISMRPDSLCTKSGDPRSFSCNIYTPHVFPPPLKFSPLPVPACLVVEMFTTCSY